MKSSSTVCKIYLLSVAVSTFVLGCSSVEKKTDIAALVKSSIDARATGNEDLAANELKEAYELLPPKNSVGRVEAINQLYTPTLDLAAELSKAGRFSLSNTMYDKAIEIESECTVSRKRSATQLKRESEQVFDTEEKILTKATTVGEMKAKTLEMQRFTDGLARRLQSEDPKKVEADARKHLQLIRDSFGVASSQYLDILRVVENALSKQNAYQFAIEIVESDIRYLTDFKEEDLRNADADAIESVYFLIPLYCDLSALQLKAKKLDEAEQNARNACKYAKIVGGKEKGRLVNAQYALGSALHAKGEDNQALDVLQMAYALARQEKRGKESVQIKELIQQIETEHSEKRRS